ncbi:MAG: ribosome silencing factor [Planctomycetota bacterium]
MAKHCAKLAEEKKGSDIKVIEIGELMPLADYFVLITCTGHRHVIAIAHEITKYLKEKKMPAPSVEGGDKGWWYLLDLGAVIIHLFEEKARSYYDFDSLWADAGAIDWE